ncbi:MAG: HAMP domain-containing sensor histidine kinase [Candidatus Thiodiazotropha sp.]
MIPRLLDLSFQHKIPLWGGALIIVSTLFVSGMLMYQAYHDLKSTLITSAGSLGSTLAQTLVPSLLHDDVWRGYEIVRAPFRERDPNNPVNPEVAMVVTMELRIFVSSDPDHYPMLRALKAAGADFAQLADAIAAHKIPPVTVVEPAESERLFVAAPMIDGDSRLGTLVLVYSRSALYVMFLRSAWGACLLGLVVLAILLPINWYWGHRLATPLVRLAHRMDEIQQRLPEQLEPEYYSYRDEMGHLFEAYNRMVSALREKALLERGIVSSERLAAVGRLTAGIAHEINNPLAGMLTALDTLKLQADLPPRTQHTIGLVERGLLQIRDTVAALLVETRQEKRYLGRQDLLDVEMLLQPAVAKRGVRLAIDVDVPPLLPIPAGPVRQVLINLLNNAVAATNQDGWVHCGVTSTDNTLRMAVKNSGEPIPPEQLEHLFEPFVTYQQGGHGLGLWVTYQLVKQMMGRIEVSCEEQTTGFTVSVPLENEEATA